MTVKNRLIRKKELRNRLIHSRRFRLLVIGVPLFIIFSLASSFLSDENFVLFAFAFFAFSTAFLMYNFRKSDEAKILITQQKDIIEQKQKEILESIEYALRIQTAILPTKKIVKQYLENSFILYKPKDIVAGDFYWMEQKEVENFRVGELENEKGEDVNSKNQQFNKSTIILFAACDCTGHGVPGAMVSVVCHNALNRAVHEFGLTEPAKILDKTAEIVIEYFSKSEEEIKDGMDISLCALTPPPPSFKEGAGGWSLQWAGANNPLWIVRSGHSQLDSESPVKSPSTIDNDTYEQHSPLSINNYQLIETKADKQPIGKSESQKPFTNHTFNLNPGDTIYLFTDGFADQFGGDTGEKKLTKKRFKDLLLSIQNKSMHEQEKELDNFITEYRKEIEQIDDILVMGVKV